ARAYAAVTREELADLEQQVQAPDLWDDQDRAKQVTAAYARARDDVAQYEGLDQRLEDADVLYELAREEDDDSQEPELEQALSELGAALDSLELRSLF